MYIETRNIFSIKCSHSVQDIQVYDVAMYTSRLTKVN